MSRVWRIMQALQTKLAAGLKMPVLIDTARGAECVVLHMVERVQLGQGAETAGYRYSIRIEYHSNTTPGTRQLAQTDELICDILDSNPETTDSSGYVYHDGMIDRVGYYEDEVDIVYEYSVTRTEVTG